MAKASDFEGKKQDDLFYFVDYSPEEAERVGYSNYSYWGSVVQNFLKHKMAVVCLVLFLFLVIFSFIALAVGKYDYQTLITDSSKAFIAPNSEYWFGTDNLGRDYWCQVWYATQVSIRLALIVAVGESILGVIIGLIWGYVRSLDRFFTELYNLIDNVPYIIYMTLIALVVGQSFTIMAVSMIAIGWLVMARRVRNMVFMFRDREYNLASRCLGTPLWRVLTKNILPYLVSVIILRMAPEHPRHHQPRVHPLLPGHRPGHRDAVSGPHPEQGARLLPRLPVSAGLPRIHRVHHLHFLLYHGQRFLGCCRPAQSRLIRWERESQTWIDNRSSLPKTWRSPLACAAKS